MATPFVPTKLVILDPSHPVALALKESLFLAVCTLAFHGRDRGTDRQEKTLNDLEELALQVDPLIRAAQRSLGLDHVSQPISREEIGSAVELLLQEISLWPGTPTPGEKDPLSSTVVSDLLKRSGNEITRLTAEVKQLQASHEDAIQQYARVLDERDEAQTDLGKIIMSLPTGKGERAMGAVEGVKLMRKRLEDEKEAIAASSIEAAASVEMTEIVDRGSTGAVVALPTKEIRKNIRALTSADVLAAHEAFVRTKMAEGMEEAATVCRKQGYSASMDTREACAQAILARATEVKKSGSAKPPSPLDDGRPCSMDVFAAHLIEDCDDHFDVREAVRHWVHGEWEQALDYLNDDTRAKLR